MDALLEQAVQGMKKNGFEVVEVRTAAEACDYLLAHIDAEKSVGVGGSVAIPACCPLLRRRAARCIPAGARSLRMCP